MKDDDVFLLSGLAAFIAFCFIYGLTGYFWLTIGVSTIIYFFGPFVLEWWNRK